MRRRDTLRNCAALGATAGLGFLAGCSGGGGDEDGTETESASMEVTDYGYEEGDSGELVVTATVTNHGESEVTGYLYVTVVAAEPTVTTTESATTENATGNATATDDGDDTVAARKSREVTVPGGESKPVEIPFEIAVEQFERDGSLDIDLRT